MQLIRRIDAIETRASKLSLSLCEVCRGAGEQYSTVWRWRRPGANPQHNTVERVLSALERHLDKQERHLRRALARRERLSA
ncbi:MAG TPA: hypothetical protein PK857_00445 [Hyphomicrobium sp.]|nr:hypothetical protein [Hyphomicrobium sp.]HRO48791.1 hypothetical protein [Hyphomicrobium sp.]